uniref:Crinkler (CRN) family protein n=1 Tax=Panagrellus redivivus TaxID=6233 RepID=A0A7E4WD34_PANRE
MMSTLKPHILYEMVDTMEVTMMSTLKPHILYEMVDTMVKLSEQREYSYDRFWKFTMPMDLCKFALSSAYGFEILAYLLTTQLTTLSSCKANEILFHSGRYANTFRTLTLGMNKQYHVQALLRISGRHCVSAFVTNDIFIHWNNTEKWVVPFYEGLVHNTVITSSEAIGDENVFEGVCRGRRVHPEIVTEMRDIVGGLPSTLMAVGDGLIKKLVITSLFRGNATTAYTAWNGLKIERIVFNKGVKRGRRSRGPFVIARDFFFNHRPKLDHLQSMRIETYMYIEYVTLMLKRYQNIPEVEFTGVKFKTTKQSVNKVLIDVQKKVDALWEAIVDHSGTIVNVKCNTTFWTTAELATVETTLSNDFVVDQAYDCVECALTRSTGSKTMEISLSFNP